MSKPSSNIFSIITAFLPSVLWAGFIYYLSSQSVLPSLMLSSWDFVFKKSAHIIVYAILYLLLFHAFRQTVPLKGSAVWLVPLAFAIAYAAFDEVHQSYVSGRHGALKDVGFDTLGCSLVIMRKFGYI